MTPQFIWKSGSSLELKWLDFVILVLVIVAGYGGMLYCFIDTEICVYRQTFNISRTLTDNKLVGHSDVVGASPVGAAPTTPSFST